jgi:hypothetical protein
MKKTNLLAILTLAATPTFLHAQTTSYSDVVGYQTAPIPVGLHSLSVPFLEPVLNSSVQTNNATSLTLGSPVGILLNSNSFYYLEIKSGSNVGERFDIDVPATIAANSSQIVINTASGNNTATFSGLALSGESVVVAKHFTLGDFAGRLSLPLTAAASVSSSDSFGLFDAGALVFYYARPDGTFKKIGNPADFKNTIIPPGSGVLYRRHGTTNQFTTTGVVRNTSFARNLSTGQQLVANPFPVDRTPVTFGMIPGSGLSDWTGGASASTGDFVTIVENGALVRFGLRSDGSVRRVGNPADFKNTELMPSGQAFIVSRAKASTDLLESSPIAGN